MTRSMYNKYKTDNMITDFWSQAQNWKIVELDFRASVGDNKWDTVKDKIYRLMTRYDHYPSYIRGPYKAENDMGEARRAYCAYAIKCVTTPITSENTAYNHDHGSVQYAKPLEFNLWLDTCLNV